MFKVSYIDKKIIDKINFILENNNLIKDDKTCTVGGYQTNNIVDLFSEDLLKEIIPEEDFYKKILFLPFFLLASLRALLPTPVIFTKLCYFSTTIGGIIAKF